MYTNLEIANIRLSYKNHSKFWQLPNLYAHFWHIARFVCVHFWQVAKFVQFFKDTLNCSTNLAICQKCTHTNLAMCQKCVYKFGSCQHLL